MSAPARTAVIVSPHPESNVGGVERVCALIADALAEDGWRVDIVGPRRQPSRWTGRFGGTWLAQSRSALRPLRDTRADLVITNGFFGWPRPSGARRVHIFHGTMVGHGRYGDVGLPRRERARRIVGGGVAEALAGRGARTVVAVSESVATEVRRYYGITVDRVVEQAVDLETFRGRDRAEARAELGLPPDGRLALYVGRVQTLKGTELVVPACRAAGFEALVAGPEALPGARWLGALAPDELAVAYAAADAVLAPSLYEGAQLVPLEALAVGTPVIGTPVGWMPTLGRLVPDYAPLIVAPEAPALAAALARLDDEDVRRAARRARDHVVEHHALATFRERWRELARAA